MKYIYLFFMLNLAYNNASADSAESTSGLSFAPNNSFVRDLSNKSYVGFKGNHYHVYSTNSTNSLIKNGKIRSELMKQVISKFSSMEEGTTISLDFAKGYLSKHNGVLYFTKKNFTKEWLGSLFLFLTKYAHTKQNQTLEFIENGSDITSKKSIVSSIANALGLPNSCKSGMGAVVSAFNRAHNNASGNLNITTAIADSITADTVNTTSDLANTTTDLANHTTTDLANHTTTDLANHTTTDTVNTTSDLANTTSDLADPKTSDSDSITELPYHSSSNNNSSGVSQCIISHTFYLHDLFSCLYSELNPDIKKNIDDIIGSIKSIPLLNSALEYMPSQENFQKSKTDTLQIRENKEMKEDEKVKEFTKVVFCLYEIKDENYELSDQFSLLLINMSRSSGNEAFSSRALALKGLECANKAYSVYDASQLFYKCYQDFMISISNSNDELKVINLARDFMNLSYFFNKFYKDSGPDVRRLVDATPLGTLMRSCLPSQEAIEESEKSILSIMQDSAKSKDEKQSQVLGVCLHAMCVNASTETLIYIERNLASLMRSDEDSLSLNDSLNGLKYILKKIIFAKNQYKRFCKVKDDSVNWINKPYNACANLYNTCVNKPTQKSFQCKNSSYGVASFAIKPWNFMSDLYNTHVKKQTNK